MKRYIYGLLAALSLCGAPLAAMDSGFAPSTEHGTDDPTITTDFSELGEPSFALMTEDKVIFTVSQRLINTIRVLSECKEMTLTSSNLPINVRAAHLEKVLLLLKEGTLQSNLSITQLMGMLVTIDFLDIISQKSPYIRLFQKRHRGRALLN